MSTPVESPHEKGKGEAQETRNVSDGMTGSDFHEFLESPESVLLLSKNVLVFLKDAGQSVAFCESLTAGLASATLASVPGASAALKGGLVTYATELKTSLAGVPASLINTYGVVSAECARAMAQGVQHACNADWGVSLTGVAGPDTQDGRPVGEVWIGIAGPDGTNVAVKAFESEQQVSLSQRGREAIRRAAVRRSFELLLFHLESM